MSQPVHVNSATGIVGLTGAGKTALLATAAEYLWETYQKVFLLNTADGGGFPSKVQSLVKHGIIRVWRMRTRGEAFETTMRASAGWFPAEIDPRTGETKPNVRLVPPMTERYTMRCPDGHVVKSVSVASALTAAVCPTCKKHVTREIMQIEKEIKRTPGFEKVGGVGFDGLSSFLSWQMSDLSKRTANLELKGEETALGGRITSGEIALGGSNRAHYGFVQARAEEMVLNSLGIPGLMLPPLWTALLLETTDSGGLSIKGPMLQGQAKTAEAPAWFGNMLEVAVVNDENGHKVRRLYLDEFVDDSGARHLVKHRGSPKMPPFLQDTAEQPWGQVNMGVFFDLLAKDIEEGAEEASTRFKDAPGLPDGEMSYGETAAAAPTATAAAPAPVRPAVTRPVARAGAVKAKSATAPTATPAPSKLVEAPAVEEAPSPTEVAPSEPAAAEAPSAAPAATVEEPAVSEGVEAKVETKPTPPSPPAVSRPGVGGKAFAPPPAPRPPAPAPRPPAPRPAVKVPGLLK